MQLLENKYDILAESRSNNIRDMVLRFDSDKKDLLVAIVTEMQNEEYRSLVISKTFDVNQILLYYIVIRRIFQHCTVEQKYSLVAFFKAMHDHSNQRPHLYQLVIVPQDEEYQSYAIGSIFKDCDVEHQILLIEIVRDMQNERYRSDIISCIFQSVIEMPDEKYKSYAIGSIFQHCDSTQQDCFFQSLIKMQSIDARCQAIHRIFLDYDSNRKVSFIDKVILIRNKKHRSDAISRILPSVIKMPDAERRSDIISRIFLFCTKLQKALLIKNIKTIHDELYKVRTIGRIFKDCDVEHQILLIEIVRGIENEGYKSYAIANIFQYCDDPNQKDSLVAIVRRIESEEHRSGIISCIFPSCTKLQKVSFIKSIKAMHDEKHRSNVIESIFQHCTPDQRKLLTQHNWQGFVQSQGSQAKNIKAQAAYNMHI